jgi:predicted AlkP superfamily pyrophosphatase or phosphodiesterase
LKVSIFTESLLLALSVHPLVAQQTPKPKLVVGIVIDQFRYDYLTRFRKDYHGGLDQLLRQGADLTNAHYQHAPTVTAVGHSIFMSGAMPSLSGIISNEWYDRNTRQEVTSVCDWDMQVVGGAQPKQGARCTDEDPASPRRLLVSTVGDELRNAGESSKVIGISLKARAAILPSGHRANAAFWFDIHSGHFITSSFYVKQLPTWAETFNSQNLPEKYVNQAWPGFPAWSFTAASGAAYSKIPASPWGNELVEKFAETAVTSEKLGQRGVTDLLTVSFSSNDYVGHAVGPDAPEVRDMSLRVDALLGQFFKLLDKEVGLQNCLIVLTADHGVSPAPPVNQERKMPGTYITGNATKIVSHALETRFGAADWIESGSGSGIYLNHKTLQEFRLKDGQPLDLQDVLDTARDAILSAPDLHATRVYSSSQLSNGIAGDFVARAFVYGFYPSESPDLTIVYEPYAIFGSGHGTTHSSPYSYDNHVPVLFMGAGIKAGRYVQEAMPNDIAPTLASLLDLETPSGSSGRVLAEILK